MALPRILFMAALAAGCACSQETLAVAPDLGDMAGKQLTTLAERYWRARAQMTAGLRTREEVAARQRYIRARMLEEIGGLPEKTPLNARITGSFERKGYRVEKLVFESQPGFFVTANVYVPEGKGPFPAVLGTAGHSEDGKAYPVYQRAFIALALRGFLVLAYDPPGQGERLEYLDSATGRSRVGVGVPEHIMAGEQCLLTGAAIARYFINDGVRAVDYLLTRPDVDPARLAVVGNSGGGTQSSYLAAFEPRLAAAVPSCYLTSWEKLWSGPGPQDAEQVFPGFLADGLDFGDFLISFAPRPIRMLTAIRDFFPIDGARATYAEAHRVFDVVDAGPKVGFFEFDDPHGWSQPRREATAAWLEKWFHGKEDSGAEPAFETEQPKALNATPAGQATASYQARTVRDLNRDLAERMYPARAANGIANAGALRGIVAGRLRVPAGRGEPLALPRGTVARSGYRIEKTLLWLGDGISIPMLEFVPEGGPARKPAVIYLNPAGKACDAGAGGDIESLALAGSVVIAPDLRGWGETGSGEGKSGYNAAYQLAMRAVLLGITLPGLQTSDVLRVFDYAAARPFVDPARISVFGKGNGGVLALFAAALEPRLAGVAAEGAVLSYLEIARAAMHRNSSGIVVPGVLKDFDLPDVARAIAPRPAWILSPARPDGSPAPLERAAALYAKPVRVFERPADAKLGALLAGWLPR
jgi:cephalosporin-C deacetylase-like acetyl esterase